MATGGNRNGIIETNRRYTKVAPLISVTELKEVYLFGIDIVDNNGNALPDSTYQKYIDNAVSMLEHDLDISVTPQFGHVEYKDYHYNDYYEFGFLEMSNYPVIELESLELAYVKDANNDDITLLEIPMSWIRLDAAEGLIRLVPNSTFAGAFQVDAAGNFYPQLLYSKMIPHAWKITYSYGFKDGCIPVAVNQAIGYIAAIQALNVGGSLVIGAGIASSSLSIDGLSQSINTTQSSENHAFSATVLQFANILWGKSERNPGLLKKLKEFYKGQDFSIL